MTATTWPRTPGYDDVVDLNRYPIGDPASPAYRELVRACRDQLRGRGVAQLAGFLTPAAVSQMLALASQLGAQAWLRDEHDENYQGVQKVLHGSPDGVLRLPSSPGTLAVFRGQHALHRVTPVSGPRPRINSVLTYGEHPGMKLTDLTQKLFYGRTA